MTGKLPSGSRKHCTLAGPLIPTVSATWRPYSISSRSLSEAPLIDSPPLDNSIVRGIAFRQRASRSQKTSIENSSPRHCSHERGRTGIGEEEVELGPVGCAVDVARAEALPCLDQQRVASVPRHLVRLPALWRGDSTLDEEAVSLELVRHPIADVRIWEQQDRRLERISRTGQDGMVEIVQRHEQTYVVLAHEVAERVYVSGSAISGTIARTSAW